MSSTLYDTQGGTLAEQVREELTRILSDPLGPALDPFRAWLPGFLEVNPPLLPISQITGFAKFLGTSTTDLSERTTSSTNYATLTGAPTLSNVADGNYLIWHGCEAHPGNNLNSANQSVSINGAVLGTTDDDCCRNTLNQYVSVGRMVAKMLSNKGSNTITVQNRGDSGADTFYFQRRWVIALKYGNL